MVIHNEIKLREVSLGEVRIELSIHEGDGWSVWLTARDPEGRRIWKTPLTDEEGRTKVYATAQEAVMDAQSQIASIMSASSTQ